MGIILPHNIEAEQAVLGAVLQDNMALAISSEIIDAFDFYEDKHQEIYYAMMGLIGQSHPIDIITLYEELQRRGSIVTAGGAAYVSSLYGAVASAANIKHHCRLVKDASLRREYISGLTKCITDAHGNDYKPGELADKASHVIFNVAGYREKKSPKVADIQESVTKWHKLANSGEMVCIPNIGPLAEPLPGYYPGHFWVVSAYTSVGKSTFLTQQVVDACRAGGKVILFTLEDSREEKLMGIQANVGNIYKRRLITGELDFEIENRLADANAEIGDWPIYIYDDVDTLDGIRLMIKKHTMQDKGPWFVGIDYAQLIHVPEARGNIFAQMQAVSKQLFRTSLDLGVCMEVLSQENNEKQKGENKDLIGTKGGGDLAAQADVLIELSRAQTDDEKSRLLNVRVRKSRKFGQTGITQLAYSYNWNRIVKPEDMNS